MHLSWRTAAAIAVLACGATVFAHPGGVDKNGCHVDARTGEHHCHGSSGRKNVHDASRPPRAGDEGVFFGPLVSVVDGDSFHARIQGVVMKFRLSGVDAPESNQPYGAKARLQLESLLRGQQLVLVPTDTDRYGRTVVHAWIGTTYVNRELVLRGAAWFYDEYARDDSLFQAEEQARETKRGLWALPLKDRVAPWDWRRERR